LEKYPPTLKKNNEPGFYCFFQRKMFCSNIFDKTFFFKRSRVFSINCFFFQNVAGYIAFKFPQYNLSCQTSFNTPTCRISTIERKSHNLTQPSTAFFEQMKQMEKLFKCFHGETDLKPGKNSIKELTERISGLVESVPEEVVTFYIRCRVFFRMRVLNKKCNRKSKKQKLGLYYYIVEPRQAQLRVLFSHLGQCSRVPP